MMNRRFFLKTSGIAALGHWAPRAYASPDQYHVVQLTAKAATKQIVGPDFPATPVWAFNGQIPGSPIRVRHGQALKITLNNALDVPTAVHWHGIRLPNAMDGVAGLTQAAIPAGGSFDYAFTPPDAGTFWYHSHVNAYEQIGRGLYGPLIIEESDPPMVDRELVWMIDDWRLQDDASIRDDFKAGHDLSHAGRIGNVPTVNGRFRDVAEVRRGERVRIRLINASNARNFALSFGDLQPLVIAIDGQPVKPFVATEPVVIGAAGRTDLIVDMSGEPGSVLPVMDSFYRKPFELVKLVYADTPLRDAPLASHPALTMAKLPEPDLDNVETYDVTLGGGAMGGLRRAQLDNQWLDLREIYSRGYVWAMNDVVGNSVDMAPLIDTKAGTSIRLTIRNETAFPHPMHLHGHHMKLLAVDGEALDEPYWVDSPLLMPRQNMEFAFVADNPGKWLFHCHILEHHASGLGALVRVT